MTGFRFTASGKTVTESESLKPGLFLCGSAAPSRQPEPVRLAGDLKPWALAHGPVTVADGPGTGWQAHTRAGEARPRILPLCCQCPGPAHPVLPGTQMLVRLRLHHDDTDAAGGPGAAATVARAGTGWQAGPT